MKRTIEKDRLIQILVGMIATKSATNRTLLMYLMNDQEYQERRAYELIAEAREEIKKIYHKDIDKYIQDRIAQNEEIIEECLEKKDKRMALEYQKELNKLIGAYATSKVDVTSNGKDIIPDKLIIEIIKRSENKE